MKNNKENLPYFQWKGMERKNRNQKSNKQEILLAYSYGYFWGESCDMWHCHCIMSKMWSNYTIISIICDGLSHLFKVMVIVLLCPTLPFVYHLWKWVCLTQKSGELWPTSLGGAAPMAIIYNSSAREFSVFPCLFSQLLVESVAFIVCL